MRIYSVRELNITHDFIPTQCEAIRMAKKIRKEGSDNVYVLEHELKRGSVCELLCKVANGDGFTNSTEIWPTKRR